jgi:hypothetical protein
MIIWRKQFTFSWGKWQNLLQIFPVYAVYCNNAMTKIVGFFSQNFSFFSKIWENVLEMIIYFLNLLIINWFEIFLRFCLCTQLLYSPYAALCINSLHINNRLLFANTQTLITFCLFILENLQTIIQIALGKIVRIFFLFFQNL